MVSLIRHELREESFFSFPLYKNMGRGGGNKVPFPRADLSIGSAQCTPSRWSSLQCTPSAFSPPPILCSYFFPIFLPPNQSLPPPPLPLSPFSPPRSPGHCFMPLFLLLLCGAQSPGDQSGAEPLAPTRLLACQHLCINLFDSNEHSSRAGQSQSKAA